jgi:hypothetical protein
MEMGGPYIVLVFLQCNNKKQGRSKEEARKKKKKKKKKIFFLQCNNNNNNNNNNERKKRGRICVVDDFLNVRQGIMCVFLFSFLSY